MGTDKFLCSIVHVAQFRAALAIPSRASALGDISRQRRLVELLDIAVDDPMQQPAHRPFFGMIGGEPGQSELKDFEGPNKKRCP